MWRWKIGFQPTIRCEGCGQQTSPGGAKDVRNLPWGLETACFLPVPEGLLYPGRE
jgi:hypothetical protein